MEGFKWGSDKPTKEDLDVFFRKQPGEVRRKHLPQAEKDRRKAEAKLKKTEEMISTSSSSSSGEEEEPPAKKQKKKKIVVDKLLKRIMAGHKKKNRSDNKEGPAVDDDN